MEYRGPGSGKHWPRVTRGGFSNPWKIVEEKIALSIQKIPTGFQGEGKSLRKLGKVRGSLTAPADMAITRMVVHCWSFRAVTRMSDLWWSRNNTTASQSELSLSEFKQSTLRIGRNVSGKPPLLSEVGLARMFDRRRRSVDNIEPISKLHVLNGSGHIYHSFFKSLEDLISLKLLCRIITTFAAVKSAGRTRKPQMIHI